MKIFRELAIIIFIYLLGETISFYLPFHFPGSIIGMLLLFFALVFKLLKIDDIKKISHFFLKYMPLFFIPAGVSVMSSFSLIQAQIYPILFTLFLSSILVLSLTALIVDFFVKRVEDD